jgi:uroporphyrin-III C-methyltransferase
MRGKVWLVGAGPGDPELLTMKAHRVIRRASVVAFDELVSAEILQLAPRRAERVPVGRRANGCRHHDVRIHPAVIQRALEGRTVVRLKGGDPSIFGRGGEEAEELARAGIPFEIIPGITAALGAGVPLTHRDVSSSVTFATAHFKDDGRALADSLPARGTVVLYMGLGRLAATCRTLIDCGRAPNTPAMVVSRATTRDERRVTGTLADIATLAARLPAPALLVVGEVVARAVRSPPEMLSLLVG